MHRIGWMLGPDEIVAAAKDAAVAATGHLPLTHACLGAAAFAGLPALVRRARTAIGNKREIAERWAKALPNARWSAPSSGLFGMVTLPGRGDILSEIEACATERGVLVAAGSFFGAPNAFRLSWATCDEARFVEGLDRLSRLVA
jgi:DNA-binding transcriptional MocR family regulator